MKKQLKYYIPINNLFLENQFISNYNQGFSSFEVRKKMKQYSSKFVTWKYKLHHGKDYKERSIYKTSKLGKWSSSQQIHINMSDGSIVLIWSNFKYLYEKWSCTLTSIKVFCTLKNHQIH